MRRQRAGPPRWQDGWATKCRERCCQSPHCANIKCAGCFQSIVFPCPPRTRYCCRWCMEDGIDIDLCETCFIGTRDDHWHTDGWLRVGPDGTHEQLEPPVPSVPPSPASSAPPPPDRLVRAVTASIEGRPCLTCSKTLVHGEQVIQLRCRCAYHIGCLDESEECCLLCSGPADGAAKTQHPDGSVFVKAEDGRTLTFGVMPTDTVSRLKELIAEEDQIAAKRLRILWKGNDILDVEALLNYIGSPVAFELRVQEAA